MPAAIVPSRTWRRSSAQACRLRGSSSNSSVMLKRLFIGSRESPDHWSGRHQRQYAERTARALLDLEGSCENHRALRRQLVELGQALQPVAAPAMHVEVRRIGRIEM